MSHTPCTASSMHHNSGSVLDFLASPTSNKDIDHRALDPLPSLTYRKKPISNLDQVERYIQRHTIK